MFVDDFTPKGRATRRRIVEAVADVVLESGAEAATLRVVGRRAGASGSQLSHYFPSRQDLVRAGVGHISAAVVDFQVSSLACVRSVAGLAEWVEEMVSIQEARGCSGPCPVGTLVGEVARHDEPTRQVVGEAFERWHAALAEMVRRLQEEGEVGAQADPEAAAILILAALQGGLALSAAWNSTRPLRQALEAAISGAGISRGT